MDFKRTLYSRFLAAAGSFCLFTSPALAQPTPPGQPAVNQAHVELIRNAEFAYQRGEFQETIKLTTQVLRQNPSEHSALYLRGSAEVELGLATGDTKMVRTGIADAREAVRLGGTDNYMYYLPYLYGMTNLTRMEGKPQHAEISVSIANQVLGVQQVTVGDRANLLYQRALAYASLKKYTEAIKDFQAAIEANPKHLGAYMAMADTYMTAGNAEYAETTFTNAVKAFPESSLVVNNRGMFYQRQGKQEKAIEDFSAAIKNDNNFIVGYTNRGFSNMELGNLEQAVADFTTSLKLEPKNPTVYSLRGTTHLRQGNTQAAIQDYQKVISIDQANPIAHSDLAFVYFFTGQYEKALQSFNQAVKINPQMTFLNPWRHQAMTALGQGVAANQTFASVTQKPEKDRNWPDHLMMYVMGQINEEQLLSKVETKEPAMKTAQTCEANFFIGLSMKNGGLTEQANSHFQAAIKTGASHLSAYRGSQFELKELDIANKP